MLSHFPKSCCHLADAGAGQGQGRPGGAGAAAASHSSSSGCSSAARAAAARRACAICLSAWPLGRPGPCPGSGRAAARLVVPLRAEDSRDVFGSWPACQPAGIKMMSQCMTLHGALDCLCLTGGQPGSLQWGGGVRSGGWDWISGGRKAASRSAWRGSWGAAGHGGCKPLLGLLAPVGLHIMDRVIMGRQDAWLGQDHGL